MAEPALEEILEIEREIHLRIEEETRRTEEWLTTQREAITRESEEKIAACRRECDLLITEAEEEARRQVAALVDEAERYASFLKELPEDKLAEYVKKHLPAILPVNGP